MKEKLKEKKFNVNKEDLFLRKNENLPLSSFTYNSQKVKHCQICHSCFLSHTYIWDKKNVLAIYKPPLRCPVCNNKSYLNKKDNPLPKEDNSLLCQCVYNTCQEVFYNRPLWYQKQQEAIIVSNNPFMPILVDNNFDKVDELLIR